MRKASVACRSLAPIVCSLALAACEARPIPMQVLANSTFVLPLQARAYGNEISISQGVQDRQRGDLIVAICPAENLWCMPVASPYPPPCPPPPGVPPDGYYLRTRYVTRVMPHPGSKAGIDGRLDYPAYGNDWGWLAKTSRCWTCRAKSAPGPTS